MTRIQEAIAGCIVGAAIGDAMGLPMEGISRRRQARMYPDIDGYHFALRRGMTSDDTEHACMVAQALLASAGNPEEFGRLLARQLRAWLLMLPAGVGFATLRACCRLLAGRHWRRSGVYSAGNGPAMRSALIGIYCHDNPQRLRELVEVSTLITHTDSKALYGALAIAVAAREVYSGQAITPDAYLEQLRTTLPADSSELIKLIEQAAQSARNGQSTPQFAESLGLGEGVSGYMYHTVPVVIHAWLRYNDDFRCAIQQVIRCGGDTDTTASILGAIVGAKVGRTDLPQDWVQGLCEWPRSVRWMDKLADRLASARDMRAPGSPERLPYLGLLARNAVFAALVLAHGFRRLLPPY